jgi:NAD(P)-dependent dehydrogenase (short-subunit alcohol dehydrogenase family)
VAADLAAPEIEGMTGVACDVSDPAAVEALAGQVRDLGPFRALVHVAGISPTMGPPRTIVDVDLVGTQRLLDAFQPLVEPGSVAVCFASSSAYQVPLFAPDPGMEAFLADPLADGFLDQVEERFTDSGLAYGWAKRGVVLAVERAAVAWGPQGGRVVSVSPGLIDTDMGRQEMANQPAMQGLLDATPLERFGTADELAAAVEFLVSDQASFVSGVDLLVDGGGHAGLKAMLR